MLRSFCSFLQRIIRTNANNCNMNDYSRVTLDQSTTTIASSQSPKITSSNISSQTTAATATPIALVPTDKAKDEGTNRDLKVSNEEELETKNSSSNSLDKGESLTDMNKLTVPSFIRLFIIHRILSKKLAKEKLTDDNIDILLIKLLGDIKRDEKQIVTQLVRFGIKRYMEKNYNEKEQWQSIESFVDKVIFQKFCKEYEQEMTYGNNNNNNNDNDSDNHNDNAVYQEMIFNMNDIMSQILQFLDFKYLSTCSLVSSHWLYHSWNINLYIMWISQN